MKIKYNNQKKPLSQKKTPYSTYYSTIDPTQKKQDHKFKQLSLPIVEGSTIGKENPNFQKEYIQQFINTNRSFKGKQIKDIQQQINKLQARTRLIQNYYRKNLKIAFDDKIKTYRLQSYMERKDQQQNLLAEAEVRQKEILTQKMKKIKQIKIGKMFGKQIINSKLEQKIQRVKQHVSSEKKEIKQVLRNTLGQLNEQNKKMRNRIHAQQMQQKQRKQLVKKLTDLKKKQVHALKIKQQIEDIIKREDKLNNLKSQLKQLTQNQVKIDIL